VDASQVGHDYWLASLTLDSFPMAAAQLLADGYDSLALRESAGMPAEDVVEVREVFVRALTQLGVYVDSREEAQMAQLRRWVKDLADSGSRLQRPPTYGLSSP
jgi:hypothetical protein